MSKVIILDETTKNPISLIGEMSGICYGSDTSSAEKNYKRGMENISSGHGRTMEFPQVYMLLDDYSARVIREYYCHIAGGPTRLQASTRYINYGEFDYITPPSIAADPAALAEYKDVMKYISEVYATLQDRDIPKEDIANILPLGMTTKVVVRTNLRNLVDMSHVRLCGRAYWEYQELMKEIGNQLSEYSPEWKTLVDMLFKPKCQVKGGCTEVHPCNKI